MHRNCNKLGCKALICEPCSRVLLLPMVGYKQKRPDTVSISLIDRLATIVPQIEPATANLHPIRLNVIINIRLQQQLVAANIISAHISIHYDAIIILGAYSARPMAVSGKGKSALDIYESILLDADPRSDDSIL